MKKIIVIFAFIFIGDIYSTAQALQKDSITIANNDTVFVEAGYLYVLHYNINSVARITNLYISLPQGILGQSWGIEVLTYLQNAPHWIGDTSNFVPDKVTQGESFGTHGNASTQHILIRKWNNKYKGFWY